MLRLTATARAFRHTRTVSGSAGGTTSVLFSPKSVIFLSGLDGNVPTDVTGSDHPSFARREESEEQDGGVKTDTLAGFPSTHSHANYDEYELESSQNLRNQIFNGELQLPKKITRGF